MSVLARIRALLWGDPPAYRERLETIVDRARATAYLAESNSHCVAAWPIEISSEQTAEILRFDRALPRG